MKVIDEMNKKELKEIIYRFEDIVIAIKDIYSSMQFAPPENYYLWLEELGNVLERTKGIEVLGSDKE